MPPIESYDLLIEKGLPHTFGTAPREEYYEFSTVGDGYNIAGNFTFLGVGIDRTIPLHVWGLKN